MKIFTYALFLIGFSIAQAQTFTNNTEYPISNNGCGSDEVLAPIMVSGLGMLDMTHRFQSVKLTISETESETIQNTEQLRIYLQAPNGTEVPLSVNNPDYASVFGNNLEYRYIDTEFSIRAATSLATIDTLSSFTGIFKPDGDFSQFQNINADGNWNLRICHSGGYSVPTKLSNWSINFEPLPTCPEPTNLVLTDLEDGAPDSIVLIDWTAGGTETE